MEILSNTTIDNNKFREFIHTIFPNNDDIVYIEDKSNNENIVLHCKDVIFSLPILFDYEKQKQAMFKTILLKVYDIKLDWGGLVGVRPTKLVHKFLSENKSFDEISDILKKVYLVKENKINLLISIVKNSIEYIDKDTVALYVGLAFCPTKCTYCSFPAYLKKGKYEKIYDKYFETLLREIEETAEILNKINVKINTVYIGGGTPSFLNYEELEKMLYTIKSKYNLNYVEEYTFEAGRIDTIDKTKLGILKNYGVTRISINPQSFKDETLKIVNRYHNIEKLNEVYNMSKSMGFAINMDFIIGLPKETTDDVLNTINKIYEYDAENITIHNLSLKKASFLTKSKYELNNLDYEKINKAIIKMSKDKQYIAYYMYRQKNSLGENIGFCKQGYQSRYNIDMIEENKNIFSIGAGAYTKLINDKEIKRILFPKDPISYVMEYEERMNKKREEILKFYEKI